MILYLLGITLGITGIVIFNPVVTLIGIGLSLTVFLREDTNAQSE